MKKHITYLPILSSIQVFGQVVTSQYRQYIIEWDSIQQKNFVVDTTTNTKAEIDYPYSQRPGHYFKHGFVYVRTSDMKGLMTVDGRKLLAPSHFIRFNEKDSIISAYICEPRTWIFLDFEGDTLSYAVTLQNNYVPELSDSLNPAIVYDQEQDSVVVGYLDKKAIWRVKPQFQHAKPFVNGLAKVKLNHKWGVIDVNGDFVITPQYETEDFEIK